MPRLLTQRTFENTRQMRYNETMNDSEWNSVTISDEERPRVSPEDLRELAADLDPDDYDEPVQEFLAELMQADDTTDLQKAATLLLQDEVDFSPELAALEIEPDMGLITLLIATGADVNALNPYGQAPLHLAAQYGYGEIVDMLLAAGARRSLRNYAGKLAAEMTDDAALKARLMPPARPATDLPLPPELVDAVAEAQLRGEHECTCGHEHGEHGCRCGHDGEHDCGCGHAH